MRSIPILILLGALLVPGAFAKNRNSFRNDGRCDNPRAMRGDYRGYRSDLPPGLQKQWNRRGTLPPGLYKRQWRDDRNRRDFRYDRDDYRYDRENNRRYRDWDRDDRRRDYFRYRN